MYIIISILYKGDKIYDDKTLWFIPPLSSITCIKVLREPKKRDGHNNSFRNQTGAQDFQNMRYPLKIH